LFHFPSLICCHQLDVDLSCQKLMFSPSSCYLPLADSSSKHRCSSAHDNRHPSNVTFPHLFTATSPIALPYCDSTNDGVDGIKNTYYPLSCNSSSNGGDNSLKTAAAADPPTVSRPATAPTDMAARPLAQHTTLSTSPTPRRHCQLMTICSHPPSSTRPQPSCTNQACP
jgi:hypothetical protein